MNSQQEKPGISRRKINSILGLGALFPFLKSEARAQSHHDETVILRTTPEGSREIARDQVKKYENDQNVVVAREPYERIVEFYGISEEEVLKLPDIHPTPDIYLNLKDKFGNSCCHGQDCRPAVLRKIGDREFAVGMNFYGSALFYTMDLDEVNVNSREELMQNNPVYNSYKHHACVVGEKIQCVVMDAEF